MRSTLSGAAAAVVAGVLGITPIALSQQSAAALPPAAPPPDSSFQKVTLNDRPGEPMDLAVLPDGSVLHTTRGGTIWHNDAATGVNSVAGTIDVYQHDEEGLQSIALAPGFDGARNNWIYLYYSPPLDTPVDDPATPDVNEGDAPFTGTPADFAPFEGVIRLSRFRYVDGQVVNSSEQQILDVPVDRGICCHVGGDIVFDSDGNLLLSTGDDTNPFFSDGYAPIDERPTQNPAFDAQRSAANTNDLRGKVLRIRPRAGGGYSIPPGNLFRRGAADTRPEIYAMGLRNPFRIEVDPETDALYVGDYSPDANEADPTRGPAGHGQVDSGHRAGQLRLAVLRDRRAAVRGLRLRHGGVRGPVRLRRPHQLLAQQHRPHPAAGSGAAARLVLVRRLPAVPGAGGGRHRPHGRTGVQLRPERPASAAAGGVAALLRRHAALLRVDP